MTERPGFLPRTAETQGDRPMSKTETGKIENDHTARTLSDDELDAVSGGLQ